ncbi:hypothetical protein [Streptomyces sp. NPDC059142]|uniref:hypothetical protein n=1 Tax=Streptomyces sp. NPDC059142 TaxID=3346739 RepID=UPI0036D1E8F9
MVATALGLPILLWARFELLGDGYDDVMRPLMVTVVILLAIAYGASFIPIAYVLLLFVAAAVAI